MKLQKRGFRLVAMALPWMVLGACQDQESSPERESAADLEETMSIEQTLFGKTPEGQEVHLFTAINRNGVVMTTTNYGAIVVSLEVPDREGNLENVTLGFDSLERYLQGHPYFGATVGRYANRIAGGKFTLDNETYSLATNNGPNHLHGGRVGFDKRVWEAEEVQSEDGTGVRFEYLSPDGEEGYPGNLQVSALYLLTDKDEMKVEFTATTDQATPVNLTNHAYWNLSGKGSGTVLDHIVMIAAERYLPVQEGLIPTGELAPVEGTPFDFTTPTRIGERIDQIESDPVGYDHCYVLSPGDGKLRLAARVRDPASGRVLEVETTQPGMQFYTGNFLSGEGSGGYQQYGGFCLETQHFPDSPNRPEFPSTILRPGETYQQTTIYKFSLDR